VNDEAAVAILNGLLAAESASLLNHLGRTQPFISWASVVDRQRVQRMIEEEDAHRRALVDAIVSLDGAVIAPPPTSEFAAVAYLDLQSLMPRIVHDKRRLVRYFEEASERLAGHRTTGKLVAHMLEHEREHLAELERMNTETRKTAATP
jgi:hypothetical protein